MCGVVGIGKRVGCLGFGPVEIERDHSPSPLGHSGAKDSQRGHLVSSGTMIAPSFPLLDLLYPRPWLVALPATSGLKHVWQILLH